MHGGLIPIVTRETSVNVEESMGVILNRCTIGEIKTSVRRISNLTISQLEAMAKSNWEFARANHSREIFAAEYARIIADIMMTEKIKHQGANVVVDNRSDSVKVAYPEYSTRLQSPE
jgi:hypothetical protein